MLEKILVVSNSHSDCETIQETLSYSLVLIADNVTQALKYLDANETIRLIFLDVDLPDMAGYHLLAILKMNEKYENIRVIIMSKSSEFEQMMSGPELASVDYLQKPIVAEPLKIIVRLQAEITNQTDLMKKMSGTSHLFDLLFKQAPFGIAITRIKRGTKGHDPLSVSVNPAYERIIGRNQDKTDTYDWRKITHPDDLRISEAYYERLINGEISYYTREKRYIRPDGTEVWVNMMVSTIETQEKDVFSHLSLIEDITDRKRIENELLESERSKSVLLSHLPGLAYRCKYDRDWTMLFVSEGCFNLTGYKAESLLHNKELSYNEMIAPEYRKVIWEEWEKIIKKRTTFRYEYQIITASGNRKWVLELGEPIYDNAGVIEALEGIVIDISALKEIERVLQHKNDHDAWTDLYNRNYLERFLARELKDKPKDKKALIVVNLNSVQTLTAIHGYHYSQDLMKEIAIKLKNLSCQKCQLFLTHENRLTFYVKGYEDKVSLINFIDKIANSIEPIVMLERISCSIGILELSNNNKPSQVDDILKNLLLASEKAFVDDESPIHYAFFDIDMEEQINRDKKIQRELVTISNGVSEDHLFLMYQPIIDLKTNLVCGFEALARLKMPEFGIVPPLDFIPLMEKTKLIIPLGEMIIRKSLMFLKKLHDAGNEELSVSINVSAIQLLDLHFTRKFLDIIKELGVDPNKIWVELTESVFANNYQEINSILGRLMDHGVRVAIDDFGTGFSSLHRLLAININCIKIDKAFMDGIELINIDEAITKDIVSLGQKLRYIVVAEGVESEIQKDYLVAYGCDRAQGYFFSRPLYEDDAVAFLSKQNNISKS